MIGIESRTTMDLDTSVQGQKMERKNIEYIIKQIIDIDLNDGVKFEYDSISNIQFNEIVDLIFNFSKKLNFK